MMKKTSCLLALIAMLLPALAGAFAAKVEFPASEAGKLAAGYIEAFNAPDEAAIAAFLQANLAPEALERMPVENRMLTLRRIRGDVGAIEPAKVSAGSDGGITVIAHGSTGVWFQMGFVFEQETPHRLAGVRWKILPEAPDLDAPDTPLTEAELVKELSAHLGGLVAKDAFSGVVLVAKGETPVFRKAYGLASKEFGLPNREDTRFNLGSLNKFITRIAIEQLAAAGKLSYDDTVEKFLPDYPNKEAAAKVTVRHLVDMTSGIGDFFGEAYTATPKNRIRNLEDYLPLFASAPLEFEPGAGNRYSNGGYVVLGLIVAKASGQSYFDYVRDHIYAPAGMTATEHLEADIPAPNVASGYTRMWNGEEHPNEPRQNNVYTRPCRGSSAGGGYSTVDDLLKLVIALGAGKLSAPNAALTVSQGMAGAGGAPGINALLETHPAARYTVIVLSNYDPPTAMSVGRAIGALISRLQ
jgi:CubicO group peptidase (beta-lactamase class C family)